MTSNYSDSPMGIFDDYEGMDSGINTQPQAFKIRNDLIEAYKGYYEDDHTTIRQFTDPKGRFCEDLFNEWIQLKIISDSPKERLERYCEWNGIIGYASSLHEIATGSISV